MKKRFFSSLVGAALVVASAEAQAQCEDLRVIVRNSVYAIHGLDAFCTEFNKMKAELAGMRSELSIAHHENAVLRARLATASSSQAMAAEPDGTTPLALDSTGDLLPR